MIEFRHRFRSWPPLLAVLLLLAGAASVRGASPEELIKTAQQAERDNQMPKAAETYESFLTQFPEHSQVVEVHFRLAKCYDLLGKFDPMEQHLRAVTDSDKKQFRQRAESFVLLAKHYAMLKKHAEAAQVLEKLLGEGSAGLHEEEALNLCAGYYAILKKYDDAAAKFNLLKLRRDSPYAESAAYKIAVLWLNAGKLDLAVSAIAEFAQTHPANANIPDLLLRAADAFRETGKHEVTASLCEQIRGRYPKSPEAQSALVLIGLSLRDRKQFKPAADIFDQVAKNRELQARGIAAEAMAQAAELYFTELQDLEGAMRRYEEAAKLARDSESESKSKILELCHFRLGEHHFARKNWAAARENYLQLRQIGSSLNIAPRLMACEQELKLAAAGTGPQTYTDDDLAQLRAEIAKNPGTFRSAELELFLLDRKLSDGLKRRAIVASLAAEYEKVLAGYPREVLAQDNLEAYIHWQIGLCRESSDQVAELKQAVTAFEKVIALDPQNQAGYKLNALEHLALCAERAGDKPRAVQAYKQLFELTRGQLDPKAETPDKAKEARAMEYLKSLITRAESGDMLEDTIRLTRQTIEERGPTSDLAREARLYLGELHVLKRDFSAAANTFQEFINVYGPRQDDNGNFLHGPLPSGFPPDSKTAQLHSAAIRLAHCWYVQRHEQNLLKAYQWIAKNLPAGNRHMAEVNYALALELAKGKEAGSKERKRAYAEALWKTVVSASTDFEAREFNKTLHFWVRPGDESFADQEPYVKNAALRAAQAYSEAGDHEIAAGIYEKYLQLYGQTPRGRQRHQPAAGTRDDEADMALYGLGRELIALGRIPKLAAVFKPYCSGHRESRYRVSALLLLGYHAGQAGLKEPAIEAYATLLDEYGPVEKDDKGRPRPLPAAQRLRQGNYHWDGLRQAPPAKLDMGEVRYSLGYLYWRNEEYGLCARTLTPFLTEPDLARTKSAQRALYMLGQSHYKTYDHINGYKVLLKLIEQHPKFDALEEVYVQATRGAVEAKAWKDVDRLGREFTLKWPKSDRKPRMDLCAALRTLYGQGLVDQAVSQLKGLATSETFEDVKADAWYWLGRNSLEFKPPRTAEALEQFEKSISVFAREPACLAAAECAIQLRQFDKARTHLDRILSEFAKANPAVVQQARALMPEVMKELAKAK